jgi:hypothetical protein
MHRMRNRLAIALGLLAVGCGSASLEQKIVTSAAEHWHCPAEQIRVQKLDADTYRASGCDHESDYACESVSSSSDKECDRVSGM